MEIMEMKEKLTEEQLTCIIFDDTIVYTSKERGIRPLLRLIDEGTAYAGFSAVDRVVGKAAAFAYVLLGIRRLHACVISEEAKKVLENHAIDMTYDMLVEYIRNREGNGRCPMEGAVLEIEDAGRAMDAVRKKLQELRERTKDEK